MKYNVLVESGGFQRVKCKFKFHSINSMTSQDLKLTF